MSRLVPEVGVRRRRAMRGRWRNCVLRRMVRSWAVRRNVPAANVAVSATGGRAALLLGNRWKDEQQNCHRKSENFPHAALLCYLPRMYLNPTEWIEE
jgi:hypothetical protein